MYAVWGVNMSTLSLVHFILIAFMGPIIVDLGILKVWNLNRDDKLNDIDEKNIWCVTMYLNLTLLGVSAFQVRWMSITLCIRRLWNHQRGRPTRLTCITCITYIPILFFITGMKQYLNMDICLPCFIIIYAWREHLLSHFLYLYKNM